MMKFIVLLLPLVSGLHYNVFWPDYQSHIETSPGNTFRFVAIPNNKCKPFGFGLILPYYINNCNKQYMLRCQNQTAFLPIHDIAINATFLIGSNQDCLCSKLQISVQSNREIAQVKYTEGKCGDTPQHIVIPWGTNQIYFADVIPGDIITINNISVYQQNIKYYINCSRSMFRSYY